MSMVAPGQRALEQKKLILVSMRNPWSHMPGPSFSCLLGPLHFPEEMTCLIPQAPASGPMRRAQMQGPKGSGKMNNFSLPSAASAAEWLLGRKIGVPGDGQTPDVETD